MIKFHRRYHVRIDALTNTSCQDNAYKSPADYTIITILKVTLHSKKKIADRINTSMLHFTPLDEDSVGSQTHVVERDP